MARRGSPVTAVIGAGYLLGAAALYAGLPDQMPPSWRMPDHGVIWLGAPMAAFLLPTAAAVTVRLLRGLVAAPLTGAPDTVNATAVYDAILLRLIVLVVGVHATVLAALLGWLWEREWAGQIVPIMLGLTMISVGNLLPRTRPNLALGIRTARTLSSAPCWRKTHRLAGYILVAGGCAVIGAALAVPAPFGPAMILAIGPLAALGISLLAVRGLPHADA